MLGIEQFGHAVHVRHPDDLVAVKQLLRVGALHLGQQAGHYVWLGREPHDVQAARHLERVQLPE